MVPQQVDQWPDQQPWLVAHKSSLSTLQLPYFFSLFVSGLRSEEHQKSKETEAYIYIYTFCVFSFFAGFGGNGATMFFLVFAILAGVVGVASKFSGGNHIRAWRNDSLAAAGSSALVAWAITALAFG